VKVSCAVRILPAEEFFWLTNAYAEPAIIVVLAYEEGGFGSSAVWCPERNVPKWRTTADEDGHYTFAIPL
jgi:hypothetical protein